MSMLTPLGKGGRRTVRRGDHPSRRGALLLAVVLTVALAGTAWWVAHRDTGAATGAAATPRRTCPKTTPAPVAAAPAAVRVNVFNATERRGLATRVAAELKRRGFRVGRVDNDPLERRVTGAAEVRSSTVGAGAARTVSAQVGQVVAVPDQRKDASVDLVLGAAFGRLQPVAAASAALSPTPQPVRTGC
jgi:hypothetical protein